MAQVQVADIIAHGEVAKMLSLCANGALNSPAIYETRLDTIVYLIAFSSLEEANEFREVVNTCSRRLFDVRDPAQNNGWEVLVAVTKESAHVYVRAHDLFK